MKTFLLLLLTPFLILAQESANQPGAHPNPGIGDPADPTISELEKTMNTLREDLQSDDQSARSLITGSPPPTLEKILNEGTLDVDFRKLFEEKNIERDKQALRDLKSIYEKAIAEKNLNLIKPHLASDFTAVMITADEVSDYDGIKAYWKKVEEFIGKDGTYTVSIEPDDTIFEGNIAIAKGIAKEHVVRNGKNIDLTSKWTAIARKESGAWKLVRIQASIDPVKNPIISAMNKGKLWITGGVAGIIGLIIGLSWRRIASAMPSN